MKYSIDQIHDEDTIVEMVPHLIVEDETQRQNFVAQYIEIMRRNPDNLLVLDVRDEAQELVAFVIAERSLSFVTITQAWSKASNPWEITNELFLRVVLWATAMGKYEIRAETRRDLDALHRRFGFTERSVNMSYQIDQNILTGVINRLQEITHGKSL